jgi:hypothetical protein
VNLTVVTLVWAFPALVLMLPLFNVWGSMGFDDGSATWDRFCKTELRPKTFPINFHLQIVDQFPSKSNKCI